MTHIQIENVMGQTIYSENISLDEARVDVSALNQGIYFVEVETKDGTFANKFIKE